MERRPGHIACRRALSGRRAARGRGGGSSVRAPRFIPRVIVLQLSCHEQGCSEWSGPVRPSILGVMTAALSLYIAMLCQLATAAPTTRHTSAHQATTASTLAEGIRLPLLILGRVVAVSAGRALAVCASRKRPKRATLHDSSVSVYTYMYCIHSPWE